MSDQYLDEEALTAPPLADDTLEPHPLSEMFPMLPETELAELAEDINRHGLREAVSSTRARSSMDAIVIRRAASSGCRSELVTTTEMIRPALSGRRISTAVTWTMKASATQLRSTTKSNLCYQPML
jgi:hypothetical protein